MTNEEKIKNMTTEELAEFLCEYMDCSKCPGCEYCYKSKTPGLNTWLKKEVEGE